MEPEHLLGVLLLAFLAVGALTQAVRESQRPYLLLAAAVAASLLLLATLSSKLSSTPDWRIHTSDHP